MGGSAFTGPPHNLCTPRMPKHVYEIVKSRCQSTLRQHFQRVSTPIDGAAKKDFGDIDILVASPLSGRALSKSELVDVLGASAAIAEADGVAWNFAIPWPSDLAQEIPQQSQSTPSDTLCNVAGRGKVHIQIDVRVCSDVKKLQWMLFKHGHGDLWNILGSIIRPYGLTVDEEALYVRIPEIEELNKNRAKVFLTSDPDSTLSFLDLPKENFWEQAFDDIHDMFSYAAKCRMFWVHPAEKKEGLGSNTQRSKDGSGEVSQGEDAKRLKSNDRRRMRTRPGFRKWIDDFLPECRAKGVHLEQICTRAQITEEALERYQVRQEFESRRDAFLAERQKKAIWDNVVKQFVPPADPADGRSNLRRGCLTKALKAIIMEGDTTYGITPAEPLLDGHGGLDAERVNEFVARHVGAIEEAAMLRHCQAYDDLLDAGMLKTKDKKKKDNKANQAVKLAHEATV